MNEASKKFKVVIEIIQSKECLMTDAFTLRELIKKPLDDMSSELQGLAFDEENDELRGYVVKGEIQYTQHDDVSSIEIYEDDIFDWTNDSRSIVKIVKGQWVFSNENGNFSVHGYCKDGKVVGNSSTHPELLKHENFKK
jgi:hypothetical protein